MKPGMFFIYPEYCGYVDKTIEYIALFTGEKVGKFQKYLIISCSNKCENCIGAKRVLVREEDIQLIIPEEMVTP